MAICKYFQQGRCKFGDNCRYEHISGGRHGYSSSAGYGGGDGRKDYGHHGRNQNSYVKPSSFTNQSYGGRNYRQDDYNDRSQRSAHDYSSPFVRNKSTPQHSQPSNDRFHWNKNSRDSNSNRFGALSDVSHHPDDGPFSDDDVKVTDLVQSDVAAWMDCKTMWPYSCLLILNRNKCVEGLPDIQPEELKVLYRLHGPEEFGKIITEVDAMYSRRKQELRDMSEQTRTSLLASVNDTTIESNPSSCLNIFTMYGPGSDFGSGTTASAAASPSSNSANQTPFSSPSANQTPFPSSAGQQTSFSAPPSDQPFSFKLPTNQSSSFGHTATQPTASANQTAFSGPFAVSSSSAPHVGARAQMFKSAPPAASGKPEVDDTAYTPKEKLTKTELEQFMAPSFTVGKYPLRPPPRELCF